MGSTASSGRRRWATAVAAMGLLVSACGGTDAGEAQRRTPAKSSSTSPEGRVGVVEPETPVHAYETWLDSLAQHDAADACRWQAPDLTIALRQEAILVDRAELGDPCTSFEALLWEDAEFESAVADIEITQETDEDALLAVTFASGTQQTVRMVYHRARWLVSSTGDRTGTGTDVSSGPARWVAVWCTLSPDQTRDEVVAAMGEPSGEYTVADGGEPQLWWAQDQYDFRAYLDPVDPYGSVLELVGDYDALDADDRAQLACSELRS